MANQAQNRSFDIGRWSTISIVFFLIISIWFILGYSVDTRFLQDEDRAGKFGDAYGYVNSFFASLAFAGLVVSILLQRKELKETREEFEKQSVAFVEQNETLSLQRFENTFFEVVKTHRVRSESLSAPGFRQGVCLLEDVVKNFVPDEDYNSGAYSKHAEYYSGKIKNGLSLKDCTSYYMESIRNVFHVIYDSPLVTEKHKPYYYHLLFVLMTNEEKSFLHYHLTMYHFLSEREKAFLKVFLTKSDFADELPPTILLNPTHIQLYERLKWHNII
jgi:hypothetical protein